MYVYTEKVENVAVGKDAVQSSTHSNSVASLAVDDNANTTACTRFNYQTDPWWSVDLGAPMTVERVVLINDEYTHYGELLINVDVVHCAIGVYCLNRVVSTECYFYCDWKRPAGRPHTSWVATMKNGLSYHITTSVWKMPPFHQAGTGQATLEVIGSKWSYALKWCKLNNDDDGGDDDDDDVTDAVALYYYYIIFLSCYIGAISAEVF